MKKQLGRKNAVCRDRSDTPDGFFHVGAKRLQAWFASKTVAGLELPFSHAD